MGLRQDRDRAALAPGRTIVDATRQAGPRHQAAAARVVAASRAARGGALVRLLCVVCALAIGCVDREGSTDQATRPLDVATPTALETVATPSPTPSVTPLRIAADCRPPTWPDRLDGPRAEHEADLDLQFNWRTAEVCQDLHQLDRDARFAPFERMVVEDGVGHRVLLLLPSVQGAVSVASYRVALAEDLDAKLIAWVAIEAGAAAHSDGVDFAVGVHDDDAPLDLATLSFERLTPRAGEHHWRPVVVDLSPYRGKAVRVVLASRERGERSGDWLLWADPRIVVAQPAPLRLDVVEPPAAGRRTRKSVPWSEANVFKAYSGFNEDRASEVGRSWVPRLFPWLSSLRILSALGANWGPTLATDYESQMDGNPTHDGREETRWAKYYEFFRDGPDVAGEPIRRRFDWSHFDRLMARVAGTGARLHVNLAGAPETFTGGKGHYQTYHFNEMPVVDEAGWKEYVATLFAHLSRQPWFGGAEVSFFSEPNCRWISDDGTVKHFGYQGDAAQYGRQYLWTWQAIEPFVRPGQVHLGPFVVEPDPAVPAVDNLASFVGAVREAFAAVGEPLPPWSAFSFNLYESPQLAIDHFASYKIDAVRRVLDEELPGTALPLRLDEVGIHPLLATSFAEAGVPDLQGSRWATAWHAEMLALLVEQGIEVASPWLFSEMMRPYGSYALLSLATQAFDAQQTPDGALAVVKAKGGAPEPLHVRLGSRSADRVGALWSGGGDAPLRLAVWQLPRFAASDAVLAFDPAEVSVGIRLPCAERCVADVVGYDDQRFAGLPDAALAGARRQRFAAVPKLPDVRRARVAVEGSELRLALAPGEVYLIELPAGEQGERRE